MILNADMCAVLMCVYCISSYTCIAAAVIGFLQQKMTTTGWYPYWTN